MKFTILMICLTLSCYLFTVSCKGVKYHACMRLTDGSNDFKEKPRTIGTRNLKIESCVKACWKMRRKYAGMQKGSRCFCSVGISGSTRVPESECDKRCNQNCNQACGGETAISVYETGYTREPPFPMRKEALIQARIGCYNKDKSSIVLCPADLSPLKTLRMTAALCVYYCDAMYQAQFSTTAGWDKCCCSNSVSGAQNGDLRLCKRKCRGDPDRNPVGCHGKKKWDFFWSTFQISRLPKFKRWPQTAFKDANWLEPQIPPGETFEIKSVPSRIGAGDASLADLLAKSLSREAGDDDGEDAGEGGKDSAESLVGADKRGPMGSSVTESVDVSEVKGKPLEKVPDEEEGNGVIIGAVVVGFLLCIAAFGYYLYSHRKKAEKKTETDDIEKSEGVGHERRDENHARKRRQKKKKKKKRTQEKDEDESEEREDEETEPSEEDNLI